MGEELIASLPYFMKYWLSILIPSIRPEGLQKLIDSLRKNSLSFNNIQIIVLKDGEPEDVKYYDNIVEITKPKVVPVSAARLNNECFKYALADWIMLCNDDVICETPGWDKIVQEAVKTNDDNVTLVWPNDNMLKERLSCFPILHRKMYELICVPLTYRRYKIDDTIFHTFPDPRKIYLSNVSFRHENDKGKVGFDLGDGRIYPVDVAIATADTELWDNEVVNRYRARKEICKIMGANWETKVIIGISTQEMARRADFYDSVNQLVKPNGCHFITAHGQSPAKARNIIFREGFERNCTHVLLLDDDIAFKPDMLTNLLNHNKDIVCGLQLMRAYPHKPLAFTRFDKDGKAEWKILRDNEKGLIPIVATGLGAVLIKLSVLENMQQPWIRLGELEADNWCDDIGFWNRVHKENKNVEMYCDLDTPIGHHCNVTLWPNKINDLWHTTYDSSGTGLAHVPQMRPENDSDRADKAVEPAIA